LAVIELRVELTQNSFISDGHTYETETNS